MLGSQYAPERDCHADLGSLMESELAFHVWRQAKSNSKEGGPQKMKGLFPGKVGEQGRSPTALLTSARSFSFTRIAKTMQMLEAAGRGQQHIHYE